MRRKKTTRKLFNEESRIRDKLARETAEVAEREAEHQKEILKLRSQIDGLQERNQNQKDFIEKLRNRLKEPESEFIKAESLEKREISAEEKHYKPFAFFDTDLLIAFSEEPVALFNPPSKIISLGDGPLSENEFDRYLIRLRIKPYLNGYPWIVVGRHGWTEVQINTLIDALIDEAGADEVRVFSQELFISGILTTHDPFSLPLEFLLKFTEGHPALEYLTRSRFGWPTIECEEELGEPVYLRSTSGLTEESPLIRMGYHVGMKGEIEPKRRGILKQAFEGPIPEVEDNEYMSEWGRPNQGKRLWRMAHHIAFLIRSRKNMKDMEKAVKEWRQDLDWLGETFFTDRMQFIWPRI